MTYIADGELFNLIHNYLIITMSVMVQNQYLTAKDFICLWTSFRLHIEL